MFGWIKRTFFSAPRHGKITYGKITFEEPSGQKRELPVIEYEGPLDLSIVDVPLPPKTGRIIDLNSFRHPTTPTRRRNR